MAKYLTRSSLTQAGVQGTLKEGGVARRAAIEEAVRKAGGTLEAFYYAFGEDDLYAIADYPDNVTAAAAAMAVAAAGIGRVRTVVLLTPEEIDAAAKKAIAYRAPGT